MTKPKTTALKTQDTGSLEHRGWLADVADICNSELAQGMATALVILSVLLGIGGCFHLEQTGRAAVKQAIKE